MAIATVVEPSDEDKKHIFSVTPGFEDPSCDLCGVGKPAFENHPHYCPRAKE
jgi:hypothetical protein